MSPNQPKTPISGFRLDPETRARLQAAAEQMNTTMTEVVKRATELIVAFNAAAEAAGTNLAEDAYREASLARHQRSEKARDALVDFLIDRDWPSATPRKRSAYRIREYGARAAAILAGEAWAIRKTWPEAAYEIQTRSVWGD